MATARKSTNVASRVPDLPPPSQTLTVRAVDGTPLHTQVFGPPGALPIVLTHGFVCEIRAWAYQIADLASDYRVIAFDHRGHGQSGVPRRGGYRVNHLAADLDCVLDATLAPGERAVLAGHSMGGMAIAAWSARYRHKVNRRAAAVALLNTTTGDLLHNLRLLSVPPGLSPARVLVGRGLVNAFGGFPVPGAARIPTSYLVAMMAVGAGSDRSAARLVYEMFARTSPAGRGGCARMLVEEIAAQHLDLSGLTPPTLVIGSERDRLTPIGEARRIARTAPNVVELVELPGGHCSMLERPEQVNHHLRSLAESVAPALHRISS